MIQSLGMLSGKSLLISLFGGQNLQHRNKLLKPFDGDRPSSLPIACPEKCLGRHPFPLALLIELIDDLLVGLR
jgi:hypothetical protein